MTQATRLIGLVLLWISIVPMAAAMDDGLSSQLVTGTLTKVDITKRIGLVTTDLGVPIFFEVTQPHLLETLSIGARVTVEIDKYGRANKIIDASVVEFLSPSTGESDSPSVQPVGGPLVGMVR
jgi:hypothetical protein